MRHCARWNHTNLVELVKRCFSSHHSSFSCSPKWQVGQSFEVLFHADFPSAIPPPDHEVVISITADDKFELFADNKTIGMGDHHDEVYKFGTDLEHGSKLRVEAVDIHAESGYNHNPRRMRGIILSTSQGLVTNSKWRCTENNGSVLPDPKHWPFAIELSNNDVSSEWGKRPEILSNASWIWAPRLPSGYYPSKVACVPSFSKVAGW